MFRHSSCNKNALNGSSSRIFMKQLPLIIQRAPINQSTVIQTFLSQLLVPSFNADQLKLRF